MTGPGRASLAARIRAARTDYLFLLPGLVIFGALILWPLVASEYYSLLQWTGFDSSGVFVGLRNYRALLQDGFFLNAFRRSMLFALVVVPVQMLLGLVFAVLLNNRLLRLSTLFRTLIFLPVVTPVAVIAIVIALMLSPFNGPLNGLLLDAGLTDRAIDFLGNPHLVLWTLCGVFVWKWTGVTMIYWLAALQTVPEPLYEAARMEGVKPWQVTLHVVLPIIAPFALVIALVSAIAALNVFPLIQAMTQGGPFFASELMEVFIFRLAFAPSGGSVPQLGYASAAGVLFALALMLLTLLQVLAMRSARRRGNAHG